MAVLVEGISVIVRKDRIRRSFGGGWDAYVATIPNQTFCEDEEVTRVGFMVSVRPATRLAGEDVSEIGFRVNKPSAGTSTTKHLVQTARAA